MFLEADIGHGPALVMSEVEPRRSRTEPRPGQEEGRHVGHGEARKDPSREEGRHSLPQSERPHTGLIEKENDIGNSVSEGEKRQPHSTNGVNCLPSTLPTTDRLAHGSAHESPPTSPTANGRPNGLRKLGRLKKMPKVNVAQYTAPPVARIEDVAEPPKTVSTPIPGVLPAERTPNTCEASDDLEKPTQEIPADVPADKTPEIEPISSSRALSFHRNGPWLIPSRSPSPSSRKLQTDGVRTPRAEQSTSGATSSTGGSNSPIRSSSSSAKARRPFSSLLTRRKSTKGDDSPITPASASSSTDRLPLRDESSVPSMPSPASKERFQSAGFDLTVRKKDELGSIFRSLDNDFQKFMSKPGTFKPSIVRNSLLPFLRNYADHSSWCRLRAEDLDRRIGVLNKWWTSLLEMLNGKNGQSVSTSDRPAFLEAVSAIMARPEWRAPASAIAAPTNRSRTTIQSKSSTSVDSNTSDFLAESVMSNVRNMFTQNLLAQMAYVVDRMAARSTPASVVTFCGKATAYAFYYCPGVADVLVRLWDLSSDAFRRVLNEYGVSRNANIRESAEIVGPQFPSHLRPLLFTSVPKLVRHLRVPPPHMDTYIDWDGPWKSRWLGKETDLFFCFTKHYYILLHNALSEDATAEQQLSAPGALLVQAQLLAVMDKSVRGAASESPELPDGTLPITFEDLLGPDASMESVTSRVAANRSMAESRLVLLLRDFLSKTPAVPEAARRNFAIAFDALLKATARRVSVYDQNACFALCDILEEAIVILSRYWKHDDPGAFLDWDFWFKVLRQMGESHNSTTDVRLFSFLYTVWGYLAASAERKRALCLEWLLENEYAARQLCHWCPMVRAYYMRLLCWRVVRYDGKGSSGDIAIFKTAHTHLRAIWEFFIHLQSEASAQRGTYLCTAPSNPVPQRRFLIVRNDSAPSAGMGFMSFDNTATSSSHSGSSTPDEVDEGKDGGQNKKRWSSLGLRGLNPFTSTSVSPAPAANPQQPASQAESQDSAPPSPTSPSSFPTAQSFKFALMPYPSGRRVIPGPRKLVPPNLPPPAQGFLQQHYPAPPKTVPRAPPAELRAATKYAGRALAEWSLLVEEVRWFLERRRQEGARVENGVWGEVPELGVETVRGALG